MAGLAQKHLWKTFTSNKTFHTICISFSVNAQQVGISYRSLWYQEEYGQRLDRVDLEPSYDKSTEKVLKNAICIDDYFQWDRPGGQDKVLFLAHHLLRDYRYEQEQAARTDATADSSSDGLLPTSPWESNLIVTQQDTSAAVCAASSSSASASTESVARTCTEAVLSSALEGPAAAAVLGEASTPPNAAP
jgi:hypothetical protein